MSDPILGIIGGGSPIYFGLDTSDPSSGSTTGSTTGGSSGTSATGGAPPPNDFSDLMQQPVTATSTNNSLGSLGPDAFLKLLIAQLQYQNPLEPTDPSSFMAQTAQFTMVEKLDSIASDSSAAALGQQLSTASALVGRDVQYLAPDGSTATGMVASATVSNGTTLINVGHDQVPLSSIRQISPHQA
jgi:flagellar basal-body rod modification protein FlgD